MLDEGYAAAPPDATPEQVREAKLIRLGQLQDALLRDARFVNSIKLHTGQGEPGGKWTIDQAVDFFVKEGYQSRSVGLVETKRGTADADVSLLHAGQAGDHEAARGPEEEAGRGVQSAASSTTTSCGRAVRRSR